MSQEYKHVQDGNVTKFRCLLKKYIGAKSIDYNFIAERKGYNKH